MFICDTCFRTTDRRRRSSSSIIDDSVTDHHHPQEREEQHHTRSTLTDSTHKKYKKHKKSKSKSVDEPSQMKRSEVMSANLLGSSLEELTSKPIPSRITTNTETTPSNADHHPPLNNLRSPNDEFTTNFLATAEEHANIPSKHKKHHHKKHKSSKEKSVENREPLEEENVEEVDHPIKKHHRHKKHHKSHKSDINSHRRDRGDVMASTENDNMTNNNGGGDDEDDRMVRSKAKGSNKRELF